MTGEEAFWHASTNTPIDQPGTPAGTLPAIVSESCSFVDHVYRYLFEDGVTVHLNQQDVAECRGRSAWHFRNMLTEKYLAAREARS